MREGRHRSIEEAAALVERNVGWATGLALRHARQHDWPSCDDDDYVQDAMLGLIEAAASFDGRGHFQGWARLRVVGAMIDASRERDHVSRGDRQKQKHGEPLVDYRGVAIPINKVSLNNYTSVHHDSPSESTLLDALTDEDRLTPEEEVLWEAFMDEVVASMDALPPRLARVLRLRYFEDHTLREVGEKMGFTESRASQMHTKALQQLRLSWQDGQGRSMAA